MSCFDDVLLGTQGVFRLCRGATLVSHLPTNNPLTFATCTGQLEAWVGDRCIPGAPSVATGLQDIDCTSMASSTNMLSVPLLQPIRQRLRQADVRSDYRHQVDRQTEFYSGQLVVAINV